MLFLLASCVSTPNLDPGNQLPGIALEASQNEVLFSWAADAPISRMLRPNTTVEVLAEYDTKYGKVTNEILARTRVRAGINGIKLELTEALKFEASGAVCLRLAVNKRPIPVRIATYEQSSNGFHYSEWEENAKHASAKQNLIERSTNLDVNVRNFSKVDPEFVTWQKENQIYRPEQCNNLNIETDLTKPETAIQGKDKLNAASEQCVALYKNYKWGNPVNYLPSVEHLNKASKENKRQLQLVFDMQKDFANFSNPKIYFPFSNFPIDNSLIQQVWGNQERLSEGIAGLIVEAYQACKTEASTRFDESYNDWLAVSNAEDIQARVEPIRRICKAKFKRDSERMQRLAEFKQEKAKTDAELSLLNKQTSSQLPSQKPLIPYACKAENI